MLVIFMPKALSARTADSRPGPGPLMRTSRFFTPHSRAALPAASAATWAAKGVLLREPLKPAPPEVAQDKAFPWRSVMVMMVLLNDACTWAMPSVTFFLTFLRTLVAALTMSSDSLIISSPRRWLCAGPCGYAHWYGYADRASAGRDDGERHG